MNFWKRIFKKTEGIDEREIPSLRLPGYCANCGLCLPSEEANVCPQCGHDQREPIAMKTTTPHKMSRAVISYGCLMSIGDEPKEYIDDLVREYGKDLDQFKKNQILNVFLLSDLALSSIVYFSHYEDNPKKDEIVKSFKEALDNYLLQAYGKERFQEVRNYIDTILTEYYEAFGEKDPLKSLSKILQYRAESLILDLPLPAQRFALPSIHTFLQYFIHVSSFLPPLLATLNKWQIK